MRIVISSERVGVITDDAVKLFGLSGVPEPLRLGAVVGKYADAKTVTVMNRRNSAGEIYVSCRMPADEDGGEYFVSIIQVREETLAGEPDGEPVSADGEIDRYCEDCGESGWNGSYCVSCGAYRTEA